MKLQKNQTITSIALILMLTASALVLATPAAKAHTPAITVPTYAFLSVVPNPVGVGQQAFVNFWIDKVPPTAAGAYGDRWHNYTVKVTRPDGTTQTLGPFTSDVEGGSYTYFTPTATGNYTFVFSFPGETVLGANPNPVSGTSNSIYVGDFFGPSSSVPVTVTVTQAPVATYLPATPLPTSYWQRPIYSENLQWYSISGNWLGLAPVGFTMITGQYNASGNFNPYTTAPNTAHILWTKPLAPGGIIGGEFGNSEYGSSYMQTPQYEPKFGGIIINGILYYQETPGSSANPAGWVAIDIRTGQTIWFKNTTVPLLCGQVLSYISPNQFGGLSYLWTSETTVSPNTGGTYGMYDAMTGNWILNIVNATTVGTNAAYSFIEANDGSLLNYYVNSTDNTLTLWNSTRAILRATGTGDLNNAWSWRPPQGANIPFSYGIQWKMPIVANYSGQAINPALSISTIGSGVVLMASTPAVAGGYSWQPGWRIIAGYSSDTGQLLWGPLNETEVPWTRVDTEPIVAGVWGEFTHETMTWSGYSASTGQKVWGPSAPYVSPPWAYYVNYKSITAYGMLFAGDFGGQVHAFNISTGQQVWQYSTGSSGYESPYGIYPVYHIEAVADGKVFVAVGHTYSPPIFRGADLIVLNATTGKLVWSVSSFVDSNQASAAVADGIFLKPNGYDNQLYAYGTGLSATTVSASPKVVSKGSSVLIEGSVTDQSPGQTCLGIPAAGTPAIADQYQTPWMEYLYMQQPMPTNATGVKVTLSTLDPNNNTYVIGTTTSDASGMYKMLWTPPVPGAYTIIATFAGSNAYYGSTAETALGVT